MGCFFVDDKEFWEKVFDFDGGEGNLIIDLVFLVLGGYSYEFDFDL